jgi:hypothetical protein
MYVHAKEVILSLMKRIDELKKKDNMKLKQDKDLKKKLKELLVLTVVVIMRLFCIVILNA